MATESITSASQHSQEDGENTHTSHLFVYGTLQKNMPNHDLFLKAQCGTSSFIGQGVTMEKYPLVLAPICNVPCLLNQPGTGEYISGEIYLVDQTKLHWLDQLESHPELYTRQKIFVTVQPTVPHHRGHLNSLSVWVYLINEFHPDLLCQPFLDSYPSKPEVLALRPYLPPPQRTGVSVSNFLKKQQHQSHLLFTYGTLKSGQPNHHHLTREGDGVATLFAHGVTAQRYPLKIAGNCNIPMILALPDEGLHVEGEIYMIDTERLKYLDEFEGHPGLYRRHYIPIQLTKLIYKGVNLSMGHHVSCWTYQYHAITANLRALPCLSNYDSAGDHGMPYIAELDNDEEYDTTT